MVVLGRSEEDCGDNRNEWIPGAYADVTLSADEQVISTRKELEEILKKLPAPDFDDPELANIAKKLSNSELISEVPKPINKEREMEVYEEAKLQQRRGIITLVAVISVIILFLMAAALGGLFLLLPRIWS